ncbi:MAG: 2-hydroxychromene-2-carboxylate isomerase [SAR86 cluster bacterium]|uniref:2-hydroxychromene-2-carboxylate isomerase n=1 Tax=SAR86 cluster bacterium TaxID=2030880 RepID=A0A2A4XH84_9GAMM|nr:MAG: 2-hydroxychromene-2-carboxylate isomerase [SAR86 cluster bacterium]
MQKPIDYYLSLVSPWSYLGHERLVKMAKQFDATIRIWPVDLSIIFPSTGGLPLPKRSEQRKAYRMQELRRWRDQSQVDLNLEPQHFPVSDKLAATMVVNLRKQDAQKAIHLAGACLRACWLEERDISNADTLLAIAAENNLDGSALLSDGTGAIETIAQDSIKAVELGVFGVPSYRLDEQLFWGQDRLEFLKKELKRALEE